VSTSQHQRHGIRDSSAYLSETAGLLDQLFRHRRTESASRMAGGEDTALGSRFRADRQDLEGGLVDRLERLCSHLRVVRAEIEREQHNLTLIEEKEKDLEMEATRTQFARAEAVQRTRLAAWRQQHAETLGLMRNIIDALKSNDEPKPAIAPPPASVRFPTHGLDGLLALGPVNTHSPQPRIRQA
jgi:hypothetical protein